MFNLETAIAEWQRQMLDAGIKTPVPLEELENHLREEIERQMRSGTDSRQAFETAVQKIGPATALKNEFKKVKAAKEEHARALTQKLGFIFVNMIPLAICNSLLLKPRGLTSGQQLSCLTAVATFTLLIWSGRLGYRLFPVIPAGRTRGFIMGLIAAPGVLWWIVFFHFVLARYDFTPGQLTVAFSWGFITPGGLIYGLLFGIDTAARKKSEIAVS